MTELNGALDGLGLPAIVRFLSGLGITGWLRLTHDGWHGELFFEAGRVVAASFGNRKGLPAIEALIQALPEGQFTFTATRAGPPLAERTVDLTPDQLLASLEELGQAAHNARSVPSLLAIPILVAQADGGEADQLRLDRGTLQTLLAVDGQRSVREIVNARGSFEALWQLGALAQLGIIELAESREQMMRPTAIPTATVLDNRRTQSTAAAASSMASAEQITRPTASAASPVADNPITRPAAIEAATVSETHATRPTASAAAPAADTQTARAASEAAAVSDHTTRPAAIPPTVVETVAPKATNGTSASPVMLPVAPVPPSAPEFDAPVVHCPKMGFEDDPTRSVARPTRLHRCFALGAPLSLPMEQQRQLCLTDHYQTCPRLEAALVPGEETAPLGGADARIVRLPTAVEPAPSKADAAAGPKPAPALPKRAHPVPRIQLPASLNGRLTTLGAAAIVVAVVGLLLAPRLLDISDDAVAIPTVSSTSQQTTSAAPAAPRSQATQAPSATTTEASAANTGGTTGAPAAPPAAQAQPTRGAAGQAAAGAAGPSTSPAQADGANAATAQSGPSAATQPGGANTASQTGANAAPAQPATKPSATQSGGGNSAAAQSGGPNGSAGQPSGLSGLVGQTGGANPASAGPRVLLDERFADNGRHWLEDPRGSATLSSGTYRLTASKAGQFLAIGAPVVDILRDVVVGASFRKVGGPTGGGFGVIVRDQGPEARDGVSQGGRYYVLEVGDKGEVGIWRRETDHWVDLLPWQRSDAVHAGIDSNEIVVRAVGDQLSLQVNGTQVGSHVDSSLSAGRIGLFVGGDQNQVTVDHFWVQTP
jgi:Domain of unknown function (DUF4388)